MADSTRRRVLITGVSSGLGEALATYYLQRGWYVYGLSRRVPKGLIDDENFRFVSVDLSAFESVVLGIRELIDVKSLDLVILNAGILGSFGDMVDASLETLHEVMDVNLWSNKLIIDFFVQEEIAVQQIVAISSGASTSGARGWNGYGISKAALNMMIKLYAAELPDTHFTALAPGLIDSPMQEDLCSQDNSPHYPTLNRIKSSRNTDAMPQPDKAAKTIAQRISNLPETVKSGEFMDIRKMK
ncbi:SDR family NAD(P)-dependent oxidoreductase [Desulfosediminicola flagellatus]|uniref:SDR family NAD(P)-dependent oxidoreductase n=1 Tax=Desulfosediminicola flagellatus TaxID=2569541 RepID=UPI0010AC6925|nr:SDR family NAD(P)-dependent oxidoreductase [Desulfosediminicola flagellatus]